MYRCKVWRGFFRKTHMCCHMLPKGVAQPEPKRGMANLAGYTSLVILNHILNPVPNPCPDPIVPCMKTSNCVCLKHVKFHCKMQTCNRRAGAVKTRRACTTEGEITIRRRESDAGGSLTTLKRREEGLVPLRNNPNALVQAHTAYTTTRTYDTHSKK